MKVSSLTKEGIPELWTVMQEFHQKMIKTGELFETRRKQQRVWMWNYITQHIMQVFHWPVACRSNSMLSVFDCCPFLGLS